VWLAARGRNAHQPDAAAGREVSPTGSGDVLLACMLFARAAPRRHLARRPRICPPCTAAANAAHPGIADFPDPLARSLSDLELNSVVEIFGRVPRRPSRQAP